MQEELISERRRGVLLGQSTQIEIAQLLDEGKSFSQIDDILEVPNGSSEYTMKCVRGE